MLAICICLLSSQHVPCFNSGAVESPAAALRSSQPGEQTFRATPEWRWRRQSTRRTSSWEMLSANCLRAAAHTRSMRLSAFASPARKEEPLLLRGGVCSAPLCSSSSWSTRERWARGDFSRGWGSALKLAAQGAVIAGRISAHPGDLVRLKHGKAPLCFPSFAACSALARAVNDLLPLSLSVASQRHVHGTSPAPSSEIPASIRRG